MREILIGIFLFVTYFTIISANTNSKLANPWTRTTTGCQCHHDLSRFDCACCVIGACQCGRIAPHQCSRCGLTNALTCVINPNDDPSNWNGFVRAHNCPCNSDVSKRNCACCDNNGCQCRNNERQCTLCGYEDICPNDSPKPTCGVPVVPVLTTSPTKPETNRDTNCTCSESFCQCNDNTTQSGGDFNTDDNDDSDWVQQREIIPTRPSRPNPRPRTTPFRPSGGRSRERAGSRERKRSGSGSKESREHGRPSGRRSHERRGSRERKRSGSRSKGSGSRENGSRERNSREPFGTFSGVDSWELSIGGGPKITEPNNVYDCQDIQTENPGFSDVDIIGVQNVSIYNISSSLKTKVVCMKDNDGTYWTIFQQRIPDGTSFHKNWYNYKMGFKSRSITKGYANGSFWSGNEWLHKVTSRKRYRLKIVLRHFSGFLTKANYETFSIGSEREGYRLNVGDYSGTAGDGLRYIGRRRSVYLHNGMKFSTQDRDNDRSRRTNCAQRYASGWWFNACHVANLNGLYHRPVAVKGRKFVDCRRARNGCISWLNARGRYSTIEAVYMMITRIKEETQVDQTNDYYNNYYDLA